MENPREEEIKGMIPNDVKTLLDIGNRNDMFDLYKTIKLDIEEADVIQDLNKKQKLEFEDNSFDMVVLSQILEHLGNVQEIINESKRVSRKYILVGLPNELKLDNRFKFLFGIYREWGGIDGGYCTYGHKHFFTIKTIEQFIKLFFKTYKKKYYIFGVKGGRYISNNYRRFLATKLPKLFAGEVYYLIKIK